MIRIVFLKSTVLPLLSAGQNQSVGESRVAAADDGAQIAKTEPSPAPYLPTEYAAKYTEYEEIPKNDADLPF